MYKSASNPASFCILISDFNLNIKFEDVPKIQNERNNLDKTNVYRWTCFVEFDSKNKGFNSIKKNPQLRERIKEVGIDHEWLVDAAKELFDPRESTWAEQPERFLKNIPPLDDSLTQ